MVIGQLLGKFANVIWPIAVAGIAALILRPLVGYFERFLKLSRVMSVIVLYGLVVIALALGLLLFVPQLIAQIVDLVASIPELWNRAGETVRAEYPGWVDLYNRAMENESLRKLVESGIEQIKGLAKAIIPNLKAAGGTLLGVIGFATNLAMVPVYLFFFLQSDEDPTAELHEYLPFLKPNTREDVVFLGREFIGIIVAFFRGQLLIGFIMGVLLAIGFTIAGLQFGVVYGLLAGLLNIIPYLGTVIGLSAVIPTAYFQADGGFLTVGLCLGVFVIVQIIEGYLLTPRIMGKQTGLHPVTIIIAIFFWGTALNGLLGMVMAIPLTAFLVTVWRLAKRKYFTPVV
jgi:predicted PurR-regulated permease PerM